jgi:hypothetical protein
MAWRQLIATVEWNRLLARRSTVPALRAVANYGLSCVFLLALLGLRVGIEGIELPERPDTSTPDYYVYYVKIAVYVAAGLAVFFAPIARVRRKRLRISLARVVTLLKLAGIMALPLLGFVVLKLAL